MKDLNYSINNQTNKILSEQMGIVSSMSNEINVNVQFYRDSIKKIIDDMNNKQKKFFKFEKIKKWIFIIACVMQPILIIVLIIKLFWLK